MQNKNLKAPFFNGYFPRYNNMSQEQLEFYNAWREEMQKGEFLDIQGSLAYVFVYMYSLSTSEDYDKILQQLLLLQEHYGEYEKINEYCARWIADCYIAKQQYEKALEYVPNDINLIKNAGKNCGLDELVKSHYGKILIDPRQHEHTDEIIPEIILMYKEFESNNKIDTVAECVARRSNYNYHLFPGVPRIPTKGKDGEIDYGIQPDPSATITPFGILPNSVTITFYEFDSRKFELFIPDCLKLVSGKIKEKYRSARPKANDDNEFNKWVHERSRQSKRYHQKEVLGYENHYLDSLAKSQHPIDKHHWLKSLTIWYFTHREYPGFIDKCIERGQEDIGLYQPCMNQYNAKDFDSLTSELGQWLRDPHVIFTRESFVNSFAEVVKKLSVVYEKLEKYDNAIEICERAIKLGIKDTTTKGGLEGRLAILRKKL